MSLSARRNEAIRGRGSGWGWVWRGVGSSGTWGRRVAGTAGDRPSFAAGSESSPRLRYAPGGRRFRRRWTHSRPADPTFARLHLGFDAEPKRLAFTPERLAAIGRGRCRWRRVSFARAG